jgi:hypothetical protein
LQYIKLKINICNQYKNTIIDFWKLLLIGLVDLPIGYHTLLRIVGTVGSVAFVVTDYENGLDFWVIAFELIAILFNPLIPLYLHDKSAWMPIDVIVGMIFFIKSFPFKQKLK